MTVEEIIAAMKDMDAAQLIQILSNAEVEYHKRIGVPVEEVDFEDIPF